MAAIAQSEQERLAGLVEQIHVADAAMKDISSRIVEYRRERGLSVEQNRRGGIVVTDPNLRELEARFAAARQRFYGVLNKRAELLRLIRQGG